MHPADLVFAGAGNVRKNPKLSGTTHNVFGIQVGVSINLLVRNRTGKSRKPEKPAIYYAAVPTDWRRGEKYRFLEDKESAAKIEWQRLQPDAKHTWLRAGMLDEFETFLPLGTKLTKQMDVGGEGAVFKTYSIGLSTNRDSVVYDFDREALVKRVEQFCDDYNAELARWLSKGKPDGLDNFLNYERVKWSRNLKRDLSNERKLGCDSSLIRPAFYRPFTTKLVYFGEGVIDEMGQNRSFFPLKDSENVLICCTNHTQIPFSAQATNRIPDAAVGGRGGQCLPFYTYAADGSERRENITDWALKEFQTRYGDMKISKWDIFHYVYAVLHHPQYRERYAANLRRELPRIPYAKDFRAFAKAGKRLAELHVRYEQQPEFPLHRRENKDRKVKVTLRVEKMRLSKDKSALAYNEFLTLEGIPPETFEYRLGNRSALGWVIDQYQVSTDKRSGITNDPNRPDEPDYIVRLLGQVVTVSLETVKVVKKLPTLEK